jgi:maltooligosyltrehalose trehalohydrolase
MSRIECATSVRRAGAFADADGSVRWRVWAPFVSHMTLVLIDGNERREIAMNAEERGYHVAAEHGVLEGQRYAYRRDDGPERPDPCSLWQPEGVEGPSAVVFPDRFSWSDDVWKGVRQPDLVFYEIHVGTFTPQGTFEAIIPRLNELRELGITAIEIMPIGQFPGSRNWGYDGVYPYAAQNTYGGPRGLQRLIDACHRMGLAVYLDVVYNHFGPESNYFGEFGPYFNDRYKTPWGSAINYDRGGCGAVREFVIDNVRMWLEDFHFDGLRLDAADMILDLGPHHILLDIKETADKVGERRGWPAVVTAESDLNDPRLLYPAERGGYAIDAQWMDDFHHAVHAFLTEERQWYYSDFGQAEQLVELLRHPYVYQGNFSAFRDRKHGARAEGLAGNRFIVFLQNHDQVGNRAAGERLGTLTRSWAKQRLAASYLLLSPYLPLLFMGEEYGEERPFPFFCSFRDQELSRAVRDGRRLEYGHHHYESAVPDPGAVETFESAYLTWSWPEGTPQAGLRRLYRDLLTARREWPALRDDRARSSRLVTAPNGNRLLSLDRGQAPEKVPVPFSEAKEGTGPFAIGAYFNLEDRPQLLPAGRFAGHAPRFSSEAEKYGGSRDLSRPITELLAFECVVFEITCRDTSP